MDKERRATPSEALQKRVNFLEAAIKDGAHHFVPVRERNIVGVLNGSPATGADLGKQYGVERERIRNLHNIGMRRFHRYSSPQTQEQFPLNFILGIDKPVSLHYREHQSESLGGTSIVVRKAIERGAKTVAEISKATGFSKKKVSRIRSTLKGWGVEVPRERQIVVRLRRGLAKKKIGENFKGF